MGQGRARSGGRRPVAVVDLGGGAIDDVALVEISGGWGMVAHAFGNVDLGVRGVADSPHGEALGDGGGDEHAVGDVADVMLGDVLEAIARPLVAERLGLDELPQPSARRGTRRAI